MKNATMNHRGQYWRRHRETHIVSACGVVGWFTGWGIALGVSYAILAM